MSSVDFDADFEDEIDDEEELLIIDDEEVIDEDEKLDDECAMDKVDQDEFEIDIDDDEEEIDIDVLDIEEKEEKEESIEDKKINITVPFITKYEYPKIISTRAQQIAAGSPIFIDVNHEDLKKQKPMEIAELELKQGKLNNIKIKRVLPNGKVEIRKLSELKFYSFY